VALLVLNLLLMVNPYEQIDIVLSYFKERSDLSADIGKENVWNYVHRTPEKEINADWYTKKK